MRIQKGISNTVVSCHTKHERGVWDSGNGPEGSGLVFMSSEIPCPLGPEIDPDLKIQAYLESR